MIDENKDQEKPPPPPPPAEDLTFEIAKGK